MNAVRSQWHRTALYGEGYRPIEQEDSLALDLTLKGVEDLAINALVATLENTAAAATELRTQQHQNQYPGTGLQPNGRWGEFDAPHVP